MSVKLVAGLVLIGGCAAFASGQTAETVSQSPKVPFAYTVPSVYQPPVNWNTNPTDAILFDNGPFVTGAVAGAGCPGDQSVLQNTSLCLNTLGYTGSTAFNLADDFQLSSAASVSSITVWGYQTTATTATITGGLMRIHAAAPVNTTDPTIATSSAATVTLTNTFRQTETGANVSCARRLQAVKFTFTPAVNLAAGTYWMSFQLAGSAALAGPFVPPVTLLGQYGKPGANSLQSNPTFLPVVDAGILGCIPTPPNPPFPVPSPAQDIPFLVEGSSGCYPDCNGDNALTIADFGCFQGKFVAQDPYADCNGDLAFTIADFGCFQGKFVTGCP